MNNFGKGFIDELRSKGMHVVHPGEYSMSVILSSKDNYPANEDISELIEEMKNAAEKQLETLINESPSPEMIDALVSLIIETEDLSAELDTQGVKELAKSMVSKYKGLLATLIAKYGEREARRELLIKEAKASSAAIKNDTVQSRRLRNMLYDFEKFEGKFSRLSAVDIRAISVKDILAGKAIQDALSNLIGDDAVLDPLSIDGKDGIYYIILTKCGNKSVALLKSRGQSMMFGAEDLSDFILGADVCESSYVYCL